jgi:ribosome-binding factor A
MKKDRIAGRKLLQLCAQVGDALMGLLPGCGDALLRELTVYLVEPAPNAGRLRVLISILDGGPDPAHVKERLKKAAGMLRAEVASAVNRKRAPELVFEVL